MVFDCRIIFVMSTSMFLLVEMLLSHALFHKMLACIACSKQLDDGEDDSTSRAPGTKEPVKSLTSQVSSCFPYLYLILALSWFYPAVVVVVCIDRDH